jgi:hypothetical protein
MSLNVGKASDRRTVRSRGSRVLARRLPYLSPHVRGRRLPVPTQRAGGRVHRHSAYWRPRKGPHLPWKRRTHPQGPVGALGVCALGGQEDSRNKRPLLQGLTEHPSRMFARSSPSGGIASSLQDRVDRAGARGPELTIGFPEASAGPALPPSTRRRAAGQTVSSAGQYCAGTNARRRTRSGKRPRL